MQLGAAYTSNFRLDQHVLPVLQSLASGTRESAAFHIRQKDYRLCLFRFESPQAVRAQPAAIRNETGKADNPSAGYGRLHFPVSRWPSSAAPARHADPAGSYWYRPPPAASTWRRARYANLPPISFSMSGPFG